MILRKPYKFLIKHFKLIHLLLFLPIIYLIIKTNQIFSFFTSYIANNYTYSNVSSLAGSYVNIFMYLAVLLIIGITLFIYYLMRQKEKSTKLYIAFIVYYIILFLSLTIFHGILSDLETTELTAKASRAYRDIVLLISLPQYFFAFYSIFRGLGFDIKQFKFESDLKDLDISDEDNEEFEFVLGVETYKYKRNIRRFIREFRYYYLENKFIFNCLGIIAGLIIATTLYMHFNVYNKSYSKSKPFSHSVFNITMLDNMITNIDYNGNAITKGKYYLVLKLSIENKSLSKIKLDTDNFRLQMGDSYLIPTLDRSEYFIDYGTPYHGEEILKQSFGVYNLVYELNEKQVKSYYKLKILESIEFKVGDLTAHYKYLNIRPKKVIGRKETRNYKLKDVISLKDTNLGNSKTRINSYEIADNYMYKYKLCNGNNCRMLDDIVSTGYATNKEKTTLLIIDVDTALDKTSVYSSSIKNKNEFYENFFTVEYDEYSATTKNITPANLKDKIVLQTTANIKDAKKLNLIITIRDYAYRVSLK